MKIDNQFLIGALLGVLGVSAWNLIYPKILTRKLLSINWGPTSATNPTWQDVHKVPKGAANAERFGISLEVAGQPALHLLDTGTYINRTTMSEQTAARLQIEQQFSKSSITTKTGKNVPVFIDVPVTIPDMPQTRINCKVEVSDTNLINPSLFLRNTDITLARTPAGNTVTFSEKNTFRYPGSIFVPFSKRDKSGRVFFTSKIGDKLVPNTVIDTGASVSTTLNQEVSDKIGIERFPISNIGKTRLVPVSFPGTSVSFISTMSSHAGHYDSKTTEWDVLISGADLLTAGFGFTITDDKGYEFFQTGLSETIPTDTVILTEKTVFHTYSLRRWSQRNKSLKSSNQQRDKQDIFPSYIIDNENETARELEHRLESLKKRIGVTRLDRRKI